LGWILLDSKTCEEVGTHNLRNPPIPQRFSLRPFCPPKHQDSPACPYPKLRTKATLWLTNTRSICIAPP
jgi:hypothetical protein